MRRILVVAHRTLSSRELIDELVSRAQADEAVFHLVVPTYHGGDSHLTWTEREGRDVALRSLNRALTRLTAAGISVTGEVGCDSPVDSVGDVLIREGTNAFDEIIVSTLPLKVSKWLKIDAPNRIRRKTTTPVFHVIGHPAEVDA